METKEQVTERINLFLKRYGELVKELKVDFANYPLWQPLENGQWGTILQSTPIDISDRKEFIAKE